MAAAEGNKDLVRRLYSGLMAKGDTAIAEEVLAEDYLDHDIPGVGEGGRQELIAAVLGVRAAFPDITPTLGPILGEGDLVAVRVEAHGTHTGAPFSPGIPATGRSITWKEVHVFRCAGGRIAEHWGFTTCSASSSSSAPSPPDPVVLRGAAGHRSCRAPVVWPASIRWPSGSRMYHEPRWGGEVIARL